MKQTVRVLVVTVALGLVGGACGTRVEREASGGQPSGDGPPSSTAAGLPGSAGTSAAPATRELVPASGSFATVPASPAVGPATGAARIPAAGGPPDRAAPSPAATSRGSGSGAVPSAPGGTAPTAPTPTPSSGPQDTSAIVIASLGTMSGPAGNVIRRVAEGVQVWVAAVNARGGVDGHPVRHIMADDGADPARHKAELRRLVETVNVVALVGNPDAGTGQAGVDYIREMRVPYVGGDGGGDWFYSTPFHFPQGPSGFTIAEAEVRDVGLYGRQHHKTKFGTLTCTEADICRVLDRVWNEKAAGYGLQPVYRGQTTLVQPDFTAECLAAQRAGVELFEIALDTNSISRLAASCARQGFRPIYGFPSGIAKANQEDDPNLEGARSTLPTFSWLQNNSPATAEFQDAMQRFGKGLRPLTGGHTGGWTAGKLFEKAVRAGGTTGPVTRATVLAGLYAIKNDTLGGLTGPLSFIAGQNAPRSTCSTGVEIVQGKWRLMNEGAFNCG